MASVKVFGGVSAIVGGVKSACRLKVEVPAGMTGQQLARWKKEHESYIKSVIDSLPTANVICEHHSIIAKDS